MHEVWVCMRCVCMGVCAWVCVHEVCVCMRCVCMGVCAWGVGVCMVLDGGCLYQPKVMRLTHL